jgi:hypothetical protein
MNLATLECRIADTPETREQVYRLRHDCYLRKGSIPARADGLFSDHYDELANNFSFLVRDTSRLALATVRISVVRPDLGWTESPASKVFGDNPAFQSIAQTSFVEASRLCFGPQARRDVFVRLLGHKAALAEFWGVEWLLACPRIEHTQVYQRMFGFRALAAPRQYFGVNFETQLLGIRRVELESHVKDKKPMRTAWTSALAALASSFRVQSLQTGY